MVSDKYLILNLHPFADKSVAGYFAIGTDTTSLLNLHERADLRPVADRASVEIDKVVDLNIPAQSYIRRYLGEAHRSTNAPFRARDSCAATSMFTIWRPRD